MTGVVLISSSIVRPRNIEQSGRAKIHLTPFDLCLLRIDYPQRGLLFPKPEPDFNLISRLKTSLSLALEIYFPLAGRLVKVHNAQDNTASFHIDCDGSGAAFHHAEAKSISLSDLIKPHGSVPSLINEFFFPADDFKSSDGVTKPLLALQVTEMKDGVFLSYCYNHLGADGVSMWNFLNAWSEICSNGSGSIHHHHPLPLKGWFLDEIAYPIHVPVPETEPPQQQQSTELSSFIFHFTKKNVSDLKAKAMSEEAGSTISSLQAVSAHMWRSVIKQSGLSREGETHCKVPVDLRQRMNPPLEKDCFGNIAYLSTAKATVEEVLDRGLGWAALQLNKLVRSQTDENCKAFAENWVRNVKNVKSSSRVGCGETIVVLSSHRFQVYSNDFGWGKPVAVRAGPDNSVSGKLVLFPGVDEGSIDVQATLWCDVLVKLLADVEFLEHVTTMV